METRKQTAVDWLVKQLEEQIRKSAHNELGTTRTGDYRIGLRKAIDFCEQAKQMEKEQMIEFAEFVATHPDKNKNYLGEMLHAKSKYDGAERTVDLFEQYYNENYEQ